MKNFLLLIVLSYASITSAQDVITLIDGGTIEAKIQEVTKHDVLYKKFSNQNGPNYHIDLNEIEKITYESGAVDIINAPKEKGQNSTSYDPRNLGRNILGLNLPDILFQNVTFSYERIVGDQGKLGIRIPVSLSLYGDNSNNFNELRNWYNIFYSGFDLNFYPTGQGQARLFLGPSFRSGYARVRDNSYNNNYYNSTSIQNTGYFSFLIQGGFIWNPIKDFSICSSFGLGSKKYFTAAPGNGNLTRAAASYNFSFAYRF